MHVWGSAQDAEKWLRAVLNLPRTQEDGSNDEDDDDDEDEDEDEDDDVVEIDDDQYDRQEEGYTSSDEQKQDAETVHDDERDAHDAADGSTAADPPEQLQQVGPSGIATTPPNASGIALTPPNASNIVYPAAARRVLQKVCKERGIKVHNAPGEADWFLAKKVISVICGPLTRR